MTLPAPIRKSVTVPLHPDDAFRLFTDRIGDWWPSRTHSVSAARGARPRSVRMEPGAGGRLVETTADGREVPWGRVIAWQPGAGLAIAWTAGQDEDAEPTEVRVTFTATDAGTRVDLVHEGFAGPLSATRAAAYARDWPAILAQLPLWARHRVTAG